MFISSRLLTYDKFMINSQKKKEASKNCMIKVPKMHSSSSSSGQISIPIFMMKPVLSMASLASKYI